MFQLSTLVSSGKKRKRIGRGGSRGGTSGKGHKGQKARTGHHGEGLGFEGGQMPLIRRLPKRGFKNTLFEANYSIVNLEQLEQLFQSGQEVTKESLEERGIVIGKKSHKGDKGFKLKILANGLLTKKLIVHADAASQAAIEAIEKAGGKIHLTKES
jgi:large subunit ribosomal protein L15